MVKNYLLFLTFMAYFYPYSSIRADDSPKVQTLPLQRESELAKLDQSFMQAWFDGEKDQWIRGTDSADGKVMLRYRAFVRAEHTANIILVHGYGERIEKFRELAFDIYSQGFNVFLYDQRGFGLSTRLSQDNNGVYVDRFDNYVWDLQKFVQFIDKEQANKPKFIFSHSMGGAVATLMVHQNPGLVQALILSTPMFEIDSKGVPNRLAEAIAHTAEALGFGKNLIFGKVEKPRSDFTQAATQSKIRWQIYLDFQQSPAQAEKISGGPTFNWLAESLSATSKIDSKEFASSITLPTLLFQADYDQYVLPGAQDRYCARAVNCQKIRFEGSRHEIYREQDSIRVPYMQELLGFIVKQRQAYFRMKLASP